MDFNKCGNWEKVHEVIRKAFGFPAYYGKNASALWDLLRDFFDDRSEEDYWEVQIFGWGRLNQIFDRDIIKKYWSVFGDISEEYPFVQFVLKS